MGSIFNLDIRFVKDSNRCKLMEAVGFCAFRGGPVGGPGGMGAMILPSPDPRIQRHEANEEPFAAETSFRKSLREAKCAFGQPKKLIWRLQSPAPSRRLRLL